MFTMSKNYRDRKTSGCLGLEEAHATNKYPYTCYFNHLFEVIKNVLKL